MTNSYTRIREEANNSTDEITASNRVQSANPDESYEERQTETAPSVGLLEGSSAQHDEIDLENQSRHLSPRQRLMNVVHRVFPFKQTYERINNGLTTGRMQTNTPGRFIGQGTDGVFRNLMAKPDTESVRSEQELHPPTYEEAAADASPEYWESTLLSPMYSDEVFVEGLTVGDYASYVWNALVCVAFPYVGFFLCYLFHTSHAAKHGSRTGLGITMVMSGFEMVPQNLGHPDREVIRYQPKDPNNVDVTISSSVKSDILDKYVPAQFKQFSDSKEEVVVSQPYFAYGLIAFGIFLVLKALVDFYRMKKMEKRLMEPREREVVNSTTEEVE